MGDLQKNFKHILIGMLQYLSQIVSTRDFMSSKVVDRPSSGQVNVGHKKL